MSDPTAPDAGERRYEQIAEALIQRIQCGIGSYQPNRRLPALKSLANQFNTSVNTILNVIRVVEERGYVRNARSFGYRINPPAAWRDESKEKGQ